jgi:membrane fusion protein (multidrug efflux system)
MIKCIAAKNCLTSKKIISILILGVMVIFGVIYLRHDSNPKSADAVTVEASPVIHGDIPIQAQAIGTLTAEKSVQITPEITGHIAKILFQDGSFVKQGTPLFQLDDQVYKAKLDSSKANLFLSETNYKRMVLLGKHGAISQQAIDQAYADTVEKKAAAEESETALEKTVLIAPFDGKVGKSLVSPGEYVAVGQGLVSLVDTQHLRVEYSVSEKYLASVKLNQAVKITTNAYPGKEFVGHVSYISPTINTDNRTITLYASIPNENNLLTAGLFVNMTQSLGASQNTLLVPASSLVATIDGQLVYKIVDGKAISTRVELGQRTMNQVEILSGLSPTDKVVTAGQQKLKDGTLVKITL